MSAFGNGCSRFDRTLAIVDVVKCRQIEGNFGMWLNPVPQLERDEFFRIYGTAAKLRHECGSGPKHTRRENLTVDPNVIFSPGRGADRPRSCKPSGLLFCDIQREPRVRLDFPAGIVVVLELRAER